MTAPAAPHAPKMVDGSIIPVGYEQLQGDLEVATCRCGESLHRTLLGGWRHWQLRFALASITQAEQVTA